MILPLSDGSVQTDLERQAAILMRSCTAGKMTVEMVYKDGNWKLGNVTVTSYPRKSLND